MTNKEILDEILKYAEKKGFDCEKILEAYKYAELYHRPHKRKSGEPYIIHPLMVTYYLTRYEADEESVIVGFLHDLVEDSDVTLEDIEERFGLKVRGLVDGLTKFQKGEFRNADSLDRKIESLRKWFELMERDVRVSIIKLVDRLHNMETLDGHSSAKKQKDIAQETMDLYVTIAGKLGINDLKFKLEELSFKYLDPENYKILSKIRSTQKRSATKVFPVIKKAIEKEVHGLEIRYDEPSLYELFQSDAQSKTGIKGVLPIDFVLIAKDVKSCYEALYLLRKVWPPNNHVIVDYVSNPTDNGYRAIHTTVMLNNEYKILFKIRTREMDDYYSYGILKNCFSDGELNHRLKGWLKNLPHVVSKDPNHSQAFWDQLKHDILGQSILVFSQNLGSLILPKNSTVLDAAFYCHGSRALSLKRILVNGIEAPLYKYLKNNDNLVFEFSNEKTVQFDWLKCVDTALGNSIVRKGLKSFGERRKINLGKKVVETELLKSGKGFLEELGQKNLKELLLTYGIKDLRELYIRVAEGDVKPSELASRIYSGKNGKHGKSDLSFATTLTVDFDPSYGESKVLRTVNGFASKVLKYSFNHKEDATVFRARIVLESKDKQFSLEKFFSQEEKIFDLSFDDLRSKFWYGMMILFTVLLWGIEPVIAYHFINNLAVEPQELILIRFWLTATPLVLWMIYSFVVNKNKLIPLFDRRIFFAVLAMLGLVFFRYTALTETTPSAYMVFHRNHLFLSAFFTIPLAAFLKERMKFLWLILLLVVANAVLLFFTPEWGWIYKMLAFLSSICFVLFNLATTSFIHKYSIKTRYYQFITLIFLYGLPIVTFFTNTTLDRVLSLLQAHIGLFLAMTGCVFIPYVLTYYVTLYQSNARYLRFSLAFSWVVTVMVQFGFLKMPVDLVVILGGLFMIAGVFVLFNINKKPSLDVRDEYIKNDTFVN